MCNSNSSFVCGNCSVGISVLFKSIPNLSLACAIKLPAKASSAIALACSVLWLTA